jgi:hypothetical protein
MSISETFSGLYTEILIILHLFVSGGFGSKWRSIFLQIKDIMFRMMVSRCSNSNTIKEK